MYKLSVYIDFLKIYARVLRDVLLSILQFEKLIAMSAHLTL